MFKYLYNWYLSIVLNLKPSKRWKNMRLCMHWVTMIPKLVIIFGLYIYDQLYQLTLKTRNLNKEQTKETRKEYFLHILNNLPVVKGEKHELYVNRVLCTNKPDGRNHNDDHQGARHGTYVFLMNQLGLSNSKQIESLYKHFDSYYGVVRGFKFDEFGYPVINAKEVSGDQLLGLCLGILPYIKNMNRSFDSEDIYNDGSISFLIEGFEACINKIIESDYSVPNETGTQKSKRARWEPGLDITGAQALTLLAALKIGESLGINVAKKEYKKVLWKYGYVLLSLFPIAFIPSKRGYFNDHNMMVALYILLNLEKSNIMKVYWKLIMLYVWSLSYKNYNGYFTGLLNDVAPNLISQNYIKKCKNYLFEDKPLAVAQELGHKSAPQYYPVKFNLMNQGEFWPDQEHRFVLNPRILTKSGLGWLAAAIMIDPEECKEFIKDTKNV